MFFLSFYSPFANIFNFFPPFSGIFLVLNCLPSMATKQNNWENVEWILQISILGVTGKDVQLAHWIVLRVLISQISARWSHKFWKPRNTELQKPMLKECKLWYEEFPGFYNLLHHKHIQHRFAFKTANNDPEKIINGVYDTNPKDDLRSCEYFSVSSELQKARNNVFSYAIQKLKAAIVDEKLDHFFKNLRVKR